MRNIESQLLEGKMDHEVTHYITSHQSGEPVHVDGSGLTLNVQDDGGRVVTVMHPHNFTTSVCRSVGVGEHVSEGQWSEELLDTDGRLAALVAHLTQHTRAGAHHQHPNHTMKVTSVRGDVDTSVILDAPMRLFNGQNLEGSDTALVVEVPTLPPLPPLQEMKRCQDAGWFNNKTKTILKDESSILTDSEGTVLDIGPSSSPAQNKQQNKKSLPHKKRISRKLKRSNGNSTPQQGIVVIHCTEEVPQEEILPDNFVAGVQDAHHMSDDNHHITHEMRAIFICQVCGEYYGDEQLKFYHHLRQHYEPHSAIIIENPVSELAMDKMTNTCIVDNVAALPDSIVELSLENTVPKTMYQPMEKHILYTSSDKTLSYSSNKLQYSMASMDKDPIVPTAETEKADLYDTLTKIECYTCAKCNKSFKKQKQCEAHIKEVHGNKLEDMGEFSEPEDLMEGIHVSVEDAGHYSPPLLPTLTVDNGTVHQEHARHWCLRDGPPSASPPAGSCGDGPYCPLCPAGPACPACPACPPPHQAPHDHHPHPLKEEVLQQILETEVSNGEPNYSEAIITENEMPATPPEDIKPLTITKKKTNNKFVCPHCPRVFQHRNSLLYHVLSHEGKQHFCGECGKGFYTVAALKVHKRVHNGDRPCKCEECGREFRQWSDLKYHKSSIHSTQKNFKCQYCGKEFARKYSLNLHLKIHTGERNYKCEYCDKGFRASSYRLSHMRTHTGVRPYKCNECEKCFRVAGDMRRHMLTHDKVRNRLAEQKAKAKDKPQDEDVKPIIKQEVIPKDAKKKNPENQGENMEHVFLERLTALYNIQT